MSVLGQISGRELSFRLGDKMPIYVYQNPDTEEYIEVLQGMNDDHIYVDDKGIADTDFFNDN